MFGKKYPQHQMIEEYSEDESEPLVEEVDADYEPTEKQVRQYAIDTLGMILPQDENLLYLAREGLKAPIPSNWVPYQSRDGEIYYKHKITQEKIYDHPTDIEYRKKYEQQKEKMARKNLKSIGIKNNIGGFAQPAGIPNQFSNLSSMNNMNFKEEENVAQPVLDPQIAEEYEKKLDELQKKEEKKWKEYEDELYQKHEKKMKKISNEHDEEMERLRSQSKFGNNRNQKEVKINEQKNTIKQRVQENQNASLQHELKLIQKNEEAKLQQFVAIYDEDRKIKVKKLQDDLEKVYFEKQQKIQQIERKNAQKHEKHRIQREKSLAHLKNQLTNPQNPEIIKATQQALKQKIQSIKDEYIQKLNSKQAELEVNLNQMKKMLGLDSAQQLQEIAARKTRMQTISEQKIKAYKNKQVQQINQEFMNQYQKKAKDIRDKVQAEFEVEKTRKTQELQLNQVKRKENFERQLGEKINHELEDLYEQNSINIAQYERNMNQKMSQLRMKFINEIQSQTTHKSEKLTQKMLVKQKQEQVKNKEEIIKNLYRQLEIDKGQYNLLKFEKQLFDADNIDEMLKDKLRREGIQYKPPAYMESFKVYENMKKKYQDDKKILSQILRNIQQTAIYPFYEKNRGTAYDEDGMHQGSSALIRKYNSDVRKMRDNEAMLKKFQIALKKAQIDDPQNIQDLKKQKFDYQEIVLKEEMGLNDEVPSFDEQVTPKKLQEKYEVPNYRNVESALKEHSKFLATVKNELNRKLYQVRSTSYY